MINNRADTSLHSHDRTRMVVVDNETVEESPLMPHHTHETAPTQFVQVADAKVAYRRFGRRGALPLLLLLNYFGANMDDWDPKITNGFAAARDVIILDYPGVGSSTGETPSTVQLMTNNFVGFCRALDLKGFDILGFSLGGMIAQQLALEYPEMVRRIILLGTGPRGGEGMTFTELSVDEQIVPEPVEIDGAGAIG